jgi:hypothetical protein
VRFAPAAEQRAALEAVLATLKPSELALPATLLKKIPPRPSGYGNSRELFPRNTGQMFDAISPAVVTADLTVGFLLDDNRAARLVEQHALDSSLPGLAWVLDQILASTASASAANEYEQEISRAVQRVVLEHLMTLAGNAGMSQVRAIATWKLKDWAASAGDARDAASAHKALLAADIKRFLERPLAPTTRMDVPAAPPGAPIGEPAMEWLRRLEPPCSMWEWY